MSVSEGKDVSASMQKLNISTSPPSSKPMAPPRSSRSQPRPKLPVVADSWDDENDGEGPAHPATKPNPRAPPPTPANANPAVASDWTSPATDTAYQAAMERGRLTPTGREDEKRPEKSTAVASRLIAAGLGVKEPRRTEEQREYDRAVKAQERKRREKEAEEEKKRVEEREKAKRAIWDD